jgi:hypothetical protein
VAPVPGGATFVHRGPSGRLEPTRLWLSAPRPLSEVMADLEARATR